MRLIQTTKMIGYHDKRCFIIILKISSLILFNFFTVLPFYSIQSHKILQQGMMGACRHSILLKFKTGSSIDIESNDHATVYTLKYERKYNLRIIHKASVIMISITFYLFVCILELFFSYYIFSLFYK